VHALAVVGQTDTITLSIQNGSSFSATSGVTVDSKGVVELDQGNLISSQVEVQAGGVLAGNGTVVGDVVVGAATGNADATLRPGLSVGQMQIQGDYEQGAGGTMAIEIDGTRAGEFDTITISGEAKLGGTLVVDATDLEPVTPGTLFPFLASGSLAEGVFEHVDTIGNEDIVFVPVYGGLASGAELAQGSSLASGVSLHDEGDMDFDGSVNKDDVPFFAMALAQPESYFDLFLIEGDQSGDIDDNHLLDFDDIDAFADLIPETSAGAVAAAVHALLNGVPEPSSLVLLISCACLASVRRSPRSGFNRRRAFPTNDSR
jgi:hypothetical protein